MYRVCGVIVTYNPDVSVLVQLLDKLDTQVEKIIVVDNGSQDAVKALMQFRCNRDIVFIPLPENKGIAAAQNIGIVCARSFEASHVVLFDQDSIPADDLVQKLLSCQQRLERSGHMVASVGPRYLDEKQMNPPPFIRVQGLKLKRCLVPEFEDAVSVDYLIASGCLIPIRVLDVVGDMAESLFIDYVDIEWGQRARSKGYKNFGCFSAKMAHSLGDEPISFLGTAYPARSPLRHYYMFRNAVLLYRMKHVPLEWKWADGLRGVLRFGFYALFAKPRLQHLKMMARGVIDGLCGRSGKLIA